MRDLDGSPRRRARRIARWATVVVPTVVLAGTLGAVGAYAAPGGNRNVVVPLPLGLCTSMGYALRATASSKRRPCKTSSRVSV